jgi:5-methylcytosine-specific restriction endonuclease McrA
MTFGEAAMELDLGEADIALLVQHDRLRAVSPNGRGRPYLILASSITAYRETVLRRRRRLDADPVTPTDAHWTAMTARVQALEDEVHRLGQQVTVLLQRRSRSRGQAPRPVLAAVLTRDGVACRYCGRATDEASRTFDHLVSIARGGDHSELNIVVACRSCNGRKGARSVAAAFMQLLPSPGGDERTNQHQQERAAQGKPWL